MPEVVVTKVLGVLRVVVAMAVVAAIAVQAVASVTAANDASRVGPLTGVVLLNLFSYFTIDSNSLAVVVLIVGAVRLAAGRVDSPGFTLLRAAAVTYLTITGVVYNILLRGLLPQGNTIGWSNEILHVVAPAFLLIDWILTPVRQRLRYRDLWPVLVFPVGWLAYTLVRGPHARDPYLGTSYWYPYPFLNPETSAHGYGTVIGYVVALTVVVIVFALGVIWLSRRRLGAARELVR